MNVAELLVLAIVAVVVFGGLSVLLWRRDTTAESELQPPGVGGAAGRYNVTRRVTFRAGWIGLFSGESQGKAVERALEDLNRNGYRVVFIIQDRWNFFRALLAWLVLIVTLGFIGMTPNVLIIGEPISSPNG